MSSSVLVVRDGWRWEEIAHLSLLLQQITVKSHHAETPFESVTKPRVHLMELRHVPPVFQLQLQFTQPPGQTFEPLKPGPSRGLWSLRLLWKYLQSNWPTKENKHDACTRARSRWCFFRDQSSCKASAHAYLAAESKWIGTEALKNQTQTLHIRETTWNNLKQLETMYTFWNAFNPSLSLVLLAKRET